VSAAEELPAPHDEAQDIYGWRLLCLSMAGYVYDHAHALAESQCDLHRALELAANDCPHDLALRILL
jgi:hypothetical protein